MTKFKLLYLNKINTNSGWGLETFLNKELKNIGIETICIDYQQNAYNLSQAILNLKDDFDALLLQRGCGYLIPLSVLKAIQRPRFFLFTELVARNPDQHYLIKSGLFDHIFFRSIPCMKWVRQQGWLQDNQMSLFLSAINPKFHRYLPEIEKDIDVLFVGTLLPRRQKIIDELSKHFSVKACTAFGEEMVHLFNRAKIILNLHGTDLPDTETRVYEALACQSFLITEQLSEEKPFTTGIHLIETSTLSEMKEQIDYYLTHEDKRSLIAGSGYREVIYSHTFSDRAKQLYTVISNSSQQEEGSLSLKKETLQLCTYYEQWHSAKDHSTNFIRKQLSRVKQNLFSRF